MSSIKEYCQQISDERDGLMGIAILAVIFYHLSCWTDSTPILSAFKWGFIGVDVFFFVSAFGLCCSYERNSCKKFYTNRFKRIFPLYVVWAFVLSLIKLVLQHKGAGLVLKQFIATSSTLSYYLPGFDHSSWFVPAIVLLYITFPFFYRIVNFLGAKVLLPMTIVSLFASYFISTRIGWYYDCLMARIPIFVLGILCYHCANKRTPISTKDILVWFAIYILSLSFSHSRFFIANMFSPIFIIAAILAVRCNKNVAMLKWFGQNSYELFLGHILGYNVVRAALGREDAGMFILIVGMVVGCFLMFSASKVVYKYIR